MNVRMEYDDLIRTSEISLSYVYRRMSCDSRYYLLIIEEIFLEEIEIILRKKDLAVLRGLFLFVN